MKAVIKAIEYALPATALSNQQLVAEFPEWSVEKITNKTGIEKRYIAGENILSSDLAVDAANKLFSTAICKATDIGFILLCTQSPDSPLPTTACLIQDKLECSNSIGALDFNLGCSGYIYGLSMAKGLIETGQVSNVLLITAETYSKYLAPSDKSVRTIFGDGAAATWVVGCDDVDLEPIKLPVFGTDGSGGKHLMVPGILNDQNNRSTQFLKMNGPEIFTFTLKVVPKLINNTLKKSRLTFEDIDLFIFHQANEYMLKVLQKKIKIPDDKFYINLKEFGNTVSSTIPIAIKEAKKAKKLSHANKVMLVGFGVGLSWGAVVVDLSLLT